eukprot:2761783-Karenia_brevis.AAC.1
MAASSAKPDKCPLCGGKHKLRACKLPGAPRFRQLLRSSQPMKAKKQSPNKPKRFSTVRSKGKYRRQTAAEYSGANANARLAAKDTARQLPVKQRRPPAG